MGCSQIFGVMFSQVNKEQRRAVQFGDLSHDSALQYVTIYFITLSPGNSATK